MAGAGSRRIYGDVFRHRVAGLGIGEVISSPSSPWQNPYAERLIGSLRRECLDHVVVLNERHLRRVLAGYMAYYHGARTHLSLKKDAPTPRRVQAPTEGRVVAFAEVGELHHRYERRAAELSLRTFCTFPRELSSRRRTLPNVLEELSGMRERPMIMSMPTTARPQHRYDHRFRNLVQRTGNVTIATDLGVPRSTARGWLGKTPKVV